MPNYFTVWTLEPFVGIFTCGVYNCLRSQQKFLVRYIVAFPKLQLNAWTFAQNTAIMYLITLLSLVLPIAVIYCRYYMEPSVVKNDGSAGFSPSGTQTNSHTGTPTHVASVTTSTAVTTPTSDIKPLSSLLGSQAKPLNLNVQVSSCQDQLLLWLNLVCLLYYL